jgi:hypothetical protein
MPMGRRSGRTGGETGAHRARWVVIAKGELATLVVGDECRDVAVVVAQDVLAAFPARTGRAMRKAQLKEFEFGVAHRAGGIVLDGERDVQPVPIELIAAAHRAPRPGIGKPLG